MNKELIDRLGGFQSGLLLAIHGIEEEALRRPERDGAWSVFDVIAHLGDLETVVAVRLRLMLAQDAPQLLTLDQEAWVARAHRGESLASVIETFWSARRGNLAIVERSSEEDLAREGIHPQYAGSPSPTRSFVSTPIRRNTSARSSASSAPWDWQYRNSPRSAA